MLRKPAWVGRIQAAARAAAGPALMAAAVSVAVAGAGEYARAHKLFGRHLMGDPVEQQKYQSFGNLVIRFPESTRPAARPGEARPPRPPQGLSKSGQTDRISGS